VISIGIFADHPVPAIGRGKKKAGGLRPRPYRWENPGYHRDSARHSVAALSEIRALMVPQVDYTGQAHSNAKSVTVFFIPLIFRISARVFVTISS